MINARREAASDTNLVARSFWQMIGSRDPGTLMTDTR
jgi:hypothetical protein